MKRLMRPLRFVTSIEVPRAGGRPMELVVDRDDVAAGDDNSTVVIDMRTGNTIEDAIERVRLPHISGGHATWVVYSSGADLNIRQGKLLAVISQQSPVATWFVDKNTTLMSLSRTNVSGAKAHLVFRYHMQVNPALVAQDIRAGVRPRGR